MQCPPLGQLVHRFVSNNVCSTSMHWFKMGQAHYGLYKAFLCEQTNRSMPFFFYCYPLHNYRYLPFCLIVMTTMKIVERATFLTSSPSQRLLLYTTTYLSHPVLYQVYLSVSPCPVLIWSSYMSHPVTGSSLPVSSFPVSGLPTCLILFLSGLPICLNVLCIWSTHLSRHVLYLVYPPVSSCPVSGLSTCLILSCFCMSNPPLSSCPVSGLPSCLILSLSGLPTCLILCVSGLCTYPMLSCIWSTHLSHLVLYPVYSPASFCAVSARSTHLSQLVPYLHGQPTCLNLSSLCLTNPPVSSCPVSGSRRPWTWPWWPAACQPSAVA